jgi:TolB protein
VICLTDSVEANAGPVWSPDAQWLAYHTSKEGVGDIFIVNISTREKIQITKTPVLDKNISWSPDGQWLVFSSDVDGIPETDDQDLFLVNIHDTANLSSSPKRMSGKRQQSGLRTGYTWSFPAKWMATGWSFSCSGWIRWRSPS